MIYRMFFSTIGRKLLMALSAIFLMVFLLQHFLINITSVFSEELFNYLSHFMGTNVVVQFVLQPVLIAGVFFHFIMGFVLEFQNRKAQKINYSKKNQKDNSSWTSRNMIWSGLVILSFLLLHFIDFWVPEISYKYVENLPENPNRYYEELLHKFENPARVTLYCVSFFFLALHLLHGFTSSIRSLGGGSFYVNAIRSFAYVYSIGIPLGFGLIAIYHYLKM